MRLATKRQIMTAYTILFMIVALIVFYPFYKNGVSLVWGAKGQDGLSQHLNAVMYWGEYIRNFFSNIVHGQLKLPMWDMSIGFGADILGTLNYYAIGDPLNLIYAFSNKYNAEYFYDFMLIFRIYLAGAAFICFGYYLKKDGNGILVGSIVYIFCGIVYAAGIRHPFFLNPMIYLPLLLMGVEKVYRKEKPYLFMFMVTIAAISNFYFFYMLTVAAVIYALLRFSQYKEEGFFKTLARFSGWYLLGIGLAAVILLPVLIAFSGNARTASDINYFSILFYKKSYYKQLILQFAGFGMIYKGTNLNYIALAYCAVIALFFRKNKQRMAYKAAFLLSCLCLLTPVGAYILHGFSYPMNRWIFIYSFIVGMIVTEMYPELFSLTKFQKIGILAGTVFYFAIALLKDRDVVKIRCALVVLMVTVVILFMVNEVSVIQKSTYRHWIIYGLVIVCAGVSSYMHYSPKYNKVLSSYVRSGEAYKTLCGKETDLIKSQKYKIQDSVYRTESLDNRIPNWNLNTNIAGITNYYSVTDKNVSDTLQQYGLKSYQYKFKFRKLDMRRGLMNLYGVRYLICTKESGKKLSKDYKLLGTRAGMCLYENKNVFPFGYTYDKFITAKQYEALNPAQKEQALLQSVVLSDDSSSAAKLKNKQLKDHMKSHVIGENYHIRNKKEQKKTIKINIPEKYARKTFYIYMEGVRTESLDGKSGTHTLGVGTNKSGFWASYGDKTIHLYDAEKNSSYDIGKREYLIKASSLKKTKGAHTLTLTFKRRNDYYIDKISVIELDKNKEDEWISKRKNSEHLENISYDGGNHFSGEIKVSEPKMLCIPIPYSKGWTASDNGNPIKIEKVNGMFLGICLDKGRHKIKLDYITPGIKAGAAISGISVIIFVVLWRRRKKQQD